MKSNQNLYIVWNPFQRRAESLAKIFDLQTKYFHFDWEERGRLFKVTSYIPKFFLTIQALVKHKPRYVFVQLAPTPLLYAVAVYSMLTGNRYVSDCHNTMLYDAHWIRWPFAKRLLRRSFIAITHNEDVRKIADGLEIPTVVLRDPLPVMDVNTGIEEVATITIKETDYVIIPCGMAADEPVEELFRAAVSVPDILFVMTWYKEGLSEELRTKAPQNIRFTGFLKEADFNALYANANAALVLTTREGTQPSGAAEAIALGIPLVLSRLHTTTRLYKDAPIYVNNEPESIASGILSALTNHDELSGKMAALRADLVDDASAQIEEVKRRLT